MFKKGYNCDAPMIFGLECRVLLHRSTCSALLNFYRSMRGGLADMPNYHLRLLRLQGLTPTSIFRRITTSSRNKNSLVSGGRVSFRRSHL